MNLPAAMPPHVSRPFKCLSLLAVAAALSLSVSGCAVRGLFQAAPTVPEALPEAGGVVQSVQKRRLFGVMPVYRPDIQQGNFISKEMVAQLRVGMTPEQVRFLLGTPLLTDVFHETRWDYPFRIKKGNGEITSSHVVVYFKDGRVSHFEGGDLPEEKDYLRRIASPEK